MGELEYETMSVMYIVWIYYVNTLEGRNRLVHWKVGFQSLYIPPPSAALTSPSPRMSSSHSLDLSNLTLSLLPLNKLLNCK